jgi:hypothetical protein
MIDRDDGRIWLSCDECGDSTMMYENDEFSEMISDAKASGWRIRSQGGSWTHTCLSCQPVAEE